MTKLSKKNKIFAFIMIILAVGVIIGVFAIVRPGDVYLPIRTFPAILVTKVTTDENLNYNPGIKWSERLEKYFITYSSREGHDDLVSPIESFNTFALLSEISENGRILRSPYIIGAPYNVSENTCTGPVRRKVNIYNYRFAYIDNPNENEYIYAVAKEMYHCDMPMILTTLFSNVVFYKIDSTSTPISFNNTLFYDFLFNGTEFFYFYCTAFDFDLNNTNVCFQRISKNAELIGEEHIYTDIGSQRFRKSNIIWNGNEYVFLHVGTFNPGRDTATDGLFLKKISFDEQGNFQIEESPNHARLPYRLDAHHDQCPIQFINTESSYAKYGLAYISGVVGAIYHRYLYFNILNEDGSTNMPEGQRVGEISLFPKENYWRYDRTPNCGNNFSIIYNEKNDEFLIAWGGRDRKIHLRRFNLYRDRIGNEVILNDLEEITEAGIEGDCYNPILEWHPLSDGWHDNENISVFGLTFINIGTFPDTSDIYFLSLTYDRLVELSERPENRAPEIVLPTGGRENAELNSQKTILVQVNDPDEGEVLNYEFKTVTGSALPGARIEITPGRETFHNYFQARIKWTPSVEYLGNNDVVLTVTDSRGASDNKIFSIFVGQPMPVVSISVTPRKQLYNVGETIYITITASVLRPFEIYGNLGLEISPQITNGINVQTVYNRQRSIRGNIYTYSQRRRAVIGRSPPNNRYSIRGSARTRAHTTARRDVLIGQEGKSNWYTINVRR